MKKNVLALSITAALVGFGFAGGAHAIVTIPTGLANQLTYSSDGVGHFLLVPYYSAQGTNNTMINLVNTDTQNAKAVKVRFRAAANSDDVFDFQVFLSPGDVWTASVTQNATGYATLHTDDMSCTKPTKAVLNSTPFVTGRLNPKRTGAALANETREGYVEIFNMADIPPLLVNDGTDNPLFTAVKHVDGVPPCKGAAWTALDTDLSGLATAQAAGLDFPTTGLMGEWTIVNATDAGAWAQRDAAIAATTVNRMPTTGNLVYFPQTGSHFGNVSTYTADPVLRLYPTMAAMYDAPDFSIPYLNTVLPGADTGPVAQVRALSGALATRHVYNEFLTTGLINATTDWVLSMPTRRYSVAVDYTKTSGEKRVFTNLVSPQYFNADNTTVIDSQVCVLGMTPTYWSQEEDTKTVGVIVSPGTPETVVFCGETSVVAINNGEQASASGLITTASGTLKATVARADLEPNYAAGWIDLATPGIATNSVYGGLPILGSAYLRATAGAHTFGGTWENKTDRVQK